MFVIVEKHRLKFDKSLMKKVLAVHFTKIGDEYYLIDPF